MRLRTLIAFVFSACVLALTLAGTLIVSRFVVERTQSRVEARMADLAEHLRQLIDANLAERLGDMAVLASAAETTATTREARRTWADIVHATYPAYAWIGFADRTGRVIASTGALLEGESVASRPWFQQGLVKPTIVDIHEAALLANKLPPLPNGEPKRFVDVSSPIHDKAGETVGVVAGHLNVLWLREMSRAAIASALARDPSVEALIFAANGTLVFGPAERQGERLLADLPILSALSAGAEQATARGFWPDGHDYFMGAARARASSAHPTLPWTFIVRQPSDVAFAPAREIVRRLMLGGCAFALIFALLGWWAAERLASPLRNLAGAAAQLDETVADMRLPAPRGYIEISELTSALTGLLARIGERDRALAAANADLERRVAERTAELVEARDRAEAAAC